MWYFLISWLLHIEELLLSSEIIFVIWYMKPKVNQMAMSSYQWKLFWHSENATTFPTMSNITIHFISITWPFILMYFSMKRYSLNSSASKYSCALYILQTSHFIFWRFFQPAFSLQLQELKTLYWKDKTPKALHDLSSWHSFKS